MMKPPAIDRMRQAIAERLSTMLKTTIPTIDIDLYPATGYWRHTKADVQQFTGYVKINGTNLSIGCWESMTDCLRYGFDLTDSRGNPRAYAHFELCAHDRRTKR